MYATERIMHWYHQERFSETMSNIAKRTTCTCRPVLYIHVLWPNGIVLFFFKASIGNYRYLCVFSNLDKPFGTPIPMQDYATISCNSEQL